MQNAQAIIDLNIAVQERDKSIAMKDARYVSLCVCVCVCVYNHILIVSDTDKYVI